MKEFQEKNKFRQRRRSRMILAVLVILCIFVIRGTIHAFTKERNSKIEMERVLAEKDRLQKRFDSIQEQTDVLKKDVGIENEIRTKFDVVKPGEGVIVIVDKELPIPPEEKKSILKKFWDSVTGVFKENSTSSEVRRLNER